MPVNNDGVQLITISVFRGEDYRFEGYARVRVTKARRTCKSIARWRGAPGQARRIADMNNIRNPRKKLKIGRILKVPGRLRDKFSFNVMPGDTAPVVVQGYGKIETVDRSERTGLSVFTGFDPVILQIPVRFEIATPSYASSRNAPGRGPEKGGFVREEGGQEIEDKIAELERMAGRGVFKGAAMGPPALVKVYTQDNKDKMVNLIPAAYQWRKGDPNSPVYWISGIDWDSDPIRNVNGNRIRQLATIELTQYVRPKATMNATERSAANENRRNDQRGGRNNRQSKKNTVLHVGDSLTVGTLPHERKELGASRVNGKGTQSATSSAVLKTLRDKLKPSHQVVVFDAGTNDAGNPNGLRNNLEAAKNAVGNKRQLIVATLNRGDVSVADLNAEIRDFAKKPGVSMVDWANKGDGHLAGDGTHATAAGYKYRAGLFSDLIRKKLK